MSANTNSACSWHHSRPFEVMPNGVPLFAKHRFTVYSHTKGRICSAIFFVACSILGDWQMCKTANLDEDIIYALNVTLFRHRVSFECPWNDSSIVVVVRSWSLIFYQYGEIVSKVRWNINNDQEFEVKNSLFHFESIFLHFCFLYTVWSNGRAALWSTSFESLTVYWSKQVRSVFGDWKVILTSTMRHWAAIVYGA